MSFKNFFWEEGENALVTVVEGWKERNPSSPPKKDSRGYQDFFIS
jgi:hypothetical protein